MYNQPFSTLPSKVSEYVDLYTVQADDQGSFWDISAAQNVLDRVMECATQQNTLVVLFVHGWHHNAEEHDSNLISFRDALTSINKEMSTKARCAFQRSRTPISP
jgi:hypothetical protein